MHELVKILYIYCNWKSWFKKRKLSRILLEGEGFENWGIGSREKQLRSIEVPSSSHAYGYLHPEINHEEVQKFVSETSKCCITEIQRWTRIWEGSKTKRHYWADRACANFPWLMFDILSVQMAWRLTWKWKAGTISRKRDWKHMW